MKVLIVDDEKPARDRLRGLLEEFDDVTLAGEAATGEQALEIASQTRPDVVLLDIRMPGLGGIETAHHLNKLEPPPAVVFATAYDEYAIEAFEARAIGYVLKPVRRERLARALEQASRLAPSALGRVAGQRGLDARRKHVCARRHDGLKLIPVEDIHYFRADQKYVCVHHEQGEDLIDDSLKSLEQEFAEDFVRIHRGMVVAIGSIDRVDRDEDGKHRVVLRGSSHENAEDLIISRRHLADVRGRLKKGK